MGRVLSEVLSGMGTMGEIGYAYHTRAFNTGALWYGLEIYTSHYKGRLNEYCARLGELPRACEGKASHMTPEAFVAWFMERVGKLLQTQKVSVTVDFRPWASIAAGNGHGFQSCFGVPFLLHQEASCYQGSSAAYAISPYTAILYTNEEDTHLTSRAWIYFPKTDEPSIAFGRIYGKHISPSVCKQIAIALGFDCTLDAQYPDMRVHEIAMGNVYLSDSISYMSNHMHPNRYITLDAICLVCGEEIDAGRPCVCSRCENGYSTCEHCGRSHDEEDMIYVDGHGMCCNDCARFCDDCDEAELIDNMTDVGGNNRYRWVCNDCLSNNYVQCDDCGDWINHNREDYTYIESCDRTVCENCIDAYVYCHGCEQYHSRGDCTICDDCGDWVCDSCACVCDECGNTYCGECMRNADICNECFNAMEDENIEELEDAIM